MHSLLDSNYCNNATWFLWIWRHHMVDLDKGFKSFLQTSSGVATSPSAAYLCIALFTELFNFAGGDVSVLITVSTLVQSQTPTDTTLPRCWWVKKHTFTLGDCLRTKLQLQWQQHETVFVATHCPPEGLWCLTPVKGKSCWTFWSLCQNEAFGWWDRTEPVTCHRTSKNVKNKYYKITWFYQHLFFFQMFYHIVESKSNIINKYQIYLLGLKTMVYLFLIHPQCYIVC